jgi:hypothetical protein
MRTDILLAAMSCCSLLIAGVGDAAERDDGIDPSECSDEEIHSRNEGHHHGSVTSRSLEVVGVYSASREDRYGVDAPFDWIAIADRHLRGFNSKRPLTIAQRRRARDLERAYLRDSYADATFARFEAGLSDAPPGPYYLIDVEGVSRAKLAGLTGEAHVHVDSQGCETQDRVFGGRVHLAAHPQRDLGGLLVRARTPLRFTVSKARAVVSGGDVAVTLAAQGAIRESWHVPANREWQIDGTVLRGATVVTVSPGGERLLFLHFSWPGNCETDVALYLLDGPEARLIGGGTTDCDV